MSGLLSGQYLTCAHNMRPDHGGTTRALLARNRMFAEHADVEPAILLFSPAWDLQQRREDFLATGLTTPSLRILNIYEHYRNHDWEDEEVSGEALVDLGPYTIDEQPLPDGSPWRTAYRQPGDTRVLYDYRRPDGSVYLRVPSFSWSDDSTWPNRIERVTPDGLVCGAFDGLGQWFRGWVRELADESRTFVFIDNRQLVPHLVPMRPANVHVIHQLHNNHLQAPRRWDSRTTPGYEKVLRRVSQMSAFVCLTERQRDDIGRRVGATTNMHVVPNPVRLPDETETSPRDPRLVTMLTRLVPQKRIEHAVRAFELVVQQVPDARLDIYGAGPLRTQIQTEIDRRGLVHAVTLRGHEPHAAKALLTSSASMLTSRYEGYPLATMESLARGCPVVAYDIGYGPREQLTDGVDGFLVDDGRIDALAARVVELLRQPGLVARMGEAGRAKAAEHGVERYLSDWAHVLESVVEQAPRRTRIRSTSLAVRELDVVGRRPGAGVLRWSRRPVSRPGFYTAGEQLQIAADIKVLGRGPGGLEDATLQLVAIGQVSGDLATVPLTAHRRGRKLNVRGTVRLADVFPPEAPPDEAVRLVLRLVWRNSARDLPLSVRPPARPSHVQLGYSVTGAVELVRFARAEDGEEVARRARARRAVARLTRRR